VPDAPHLVEAGTTFMTPQQHVARRTWHVARDRIIDMAIRDALLPEYDHEMATTRRLLDRVPEQHFAWKPHERSMTLGQLASHLANLPFWAGPILTAESFDLADMPEDTRPRMPVSREALVQEFDGKVTATRRLIANAADGDMAARWTLTRGGVEMFSMPRIAALRSFVMNHSIHHRGQLSVYLRLQNVPLPPIYGPTADEA
jgi:uncharacterized damage-inducible protein DinB